MIIMIEINVNPELTEKLQFAKVKCLSIAFGDRFKVEVHIIIVGQGHGLPRGKKVV